MNFIWGKRIYTKEQCSLDADITHQFPEHQIPFGILFAAANLDGLVNLLVNEINVHAQQNGREMRASRKAFLETK